MRLCLNAIVKNEAARIARMLASVKPYISCFAITDTGSTDDTVDVIGRFFAAARKTDEATPPFPGKISRVSFDNFSQARNAALCAAQHSGFDYDYLLLVDADMELKVDDSSCFDNLTANAYQLIQKGCGLTYRNTRLVKRGCGAEYRGVTHEYLSVPGDTMPLDGAWFIDHADGSNRENKFVRDLRLLDEDLKRDPNNARSHFYRAQTLKDMGRFAEAAAAYEKRAELGGWNEETAYAWLQASRCVRAFERW